MWTPARQHSLCIFYWSEMTYGWQPNAIMITDIKYGGVGQLYFRAWSKHTYVVYSDVHQMGEVSSLSQQFTHTSIIKNSAYFNLSTFYIHACRLVDVDVEKLSSSWPLISQRIRTLNVLRVRTLNVLSYNGTSLWNWPSPCVNFIPNLSRLVGSSDKHHQLLSKAGGRSTFRVSRHINCLDREDYDGQHINQTTLSTLIAYREISKYCSTLECARISSRQRSASLSVRDSVQD